MYGLPGIITFRTVGLSEEAARAQSKANNKSELIKYLLELYAREKAKGGDGDGQAARK